MKKQTSETDKLTIRFPSNLIARLKALAAARNTTATNILMEAYSDYEKKQPSDLRRALDLISAESKKHTSSD